MEAAQNGAGDHGVHVARGTRVVVVDLRGTVVGGSVVVVAGRVVVVVVEDDDVVVVEEMAVEVVPPPVTANTGSVVSLAPGPGDVVVDADAAP